MTAEETRAILTVSMLAAFVDGDKHERERAEIKRIEEGLSRAEGVNLPGLYQDVLMKRTSLTDAASALATDDSRQLAYEMAVCVCDADGVQSVAEQTFLAELGRALRRVPAVSGAFSEQAEAMAAAPLAPPPVAASAAKAPVDPAELDKSILNAVIVNGALELLPESLSTMAIIPLQMKLVYRIGQAHGYKLDRGHIKDFLATAGVGLTSQYLEQPGASC